MIARWLLRRLYDEAHREIIEGDIEELFRARLEARGRAVATLRYLADLLSIIHQRHRRGYRPEERPPLPSTGRSKATIREILVDKLLQDIKFAARALAGSPGFTAVVVLTLGLGIGANSTIFSVVNGVLLQPLPYRDPGRIVQVSEIDPTVERDRGRIASQRLFLAWRESGSAFSDLAMYSNQAATLTGLEEPVRLSGISASPSLFRLLGVDAYQGRTFTPEEETAGNDNVIVISNSAWQRYLGGDPAAIGSQLQLDDRSRTLVGVMPPGFGFPDPGVEFWVPMIIQPLGEGGDDALARQAATSVRETRETRRRGPGGGGAGGAGGAGGGGEPGAGGGGPEPDGAHIELWGQMVGRLADDIGVARATEEGTSLARGTRADTAEPDDQSSVELVVLQEELVGPVRSSLTMLMGAVGFVLLIACANVANLVLARSAGRSKETAVRAALGAGRLQLVRLLMVEGLALAGLGGLLGLVLTASGLQMLRSIGAEFIPRMETAGVDGWALGFTLVISILTGVLFSLMPARGAAALDLSGALKQGSTNDGASKTLGRDTFRRLLVTAEVALSVVLLVGAGLLVSSFVRLATVDPGYDPENVLSIGLQLPQTRYSSAESYINFFDESVAALEQIPGVQAVTLASVPPTREPNIRIGLAMSDEPDAADRPPTTFGIRVVEPRFFETLRMELVAGRFFSRDDRAGNSPVAVVNQSAARSIFPDEDPVGRRFPFLGREELEIVGVVADARTAGVDPSSAPEVYLPLPQAPGRLVSGLFRSAGLLIRTGPAPMSVLPAVRSRMVEIDPEVPVFRVTTMRDQISDSVAAPRFYAALVSAFAVLAVTLAAVGIYGVLSYSVQQGFRETAIRRALGAQGGEILGRVVAQGMALALIGLALGIGGALALTRVLESMLYEVEPSDPVTIVVAATVFLAVALAAIVVPARRATKIDPMEALRYEG